MTNTETAALARIRQMADAWEQQLPEVIRTPAVVSALRAAMERAEPAAVSAAVAPPTNQTTTGASETPRQWCKCPSCWGWFVEEHPGEDLDELGTDLSWWSGLPEHRNAPDSELRRMADETATTETPFTPPAHYRRDDGVECCVHTIPVGPNSCPACRELAHNGPAAGPTIVDQVVAALQAKAQALSVEAEEEMRRDLEEQAQVWHEAADLARRTGRKAARSTQPAAGARQDGATP